VKSKEHAFMSEALLNCGPIEYDDTGGDLPVVVFIGGLFIGTSLWDGVVADLRADLRCIVPRLPWGAHRHPMRRDADLSISGQTRVLADFIDHLSLNDITLVESDTAMAQLLVTFRPQRLGRVVFCSSETADNYPPGLPGQAAALIAKLPGGVNIAMQQMRFRAFRHSPIGFGRMAKRPIPEDVVKDWLAPVLTQRAIRRDATKYLRSVRSSRSALKEATERLHTFDRPTLVVWATEDRVMPLDQGKKLAESLRSSRFVEIADSYTLIALDQPRLLAGEIRRFISETATSTNPLSRGVEPTGFSAPHP
jgi:pimeloyl-ACP methyl ester carboxylesterase